MPIPNYNEHLLAQQNNVNLCFIGDTHDEIRHLEALIALLQRADFGRPQAVFIEHFYRLNNQPQELNNQDIALTVRNMEEIALMAYLEGRNFAYHPQQGQRLIELAQWCSNNQVCLYGMDAPFVPPENATVIQRVAAKLRFRASSEEGSSNAAWSQCIVEQMTQNQHQRALIFGGRAHFAALGVLFPGLSGHSFNLEENEYLAL